MAIRHGTLCYFRGMTLPGWMTCGVHVVLVGGPGHVYTQVGLPLVFRRLLPGACAGAPTSSCLGPWSGLSPLCFVCCACFAPGWSLVRGFRLVCGLSPFGPPARPALVVVAVCPDPVPLPTPTTLLLFCFYSTVASALADKWRGLLSLFQHF